MNKNQKEKEKDRKVTISWTSTPRVKKKGKVYMSVKRRHVLNVGSHKIQ